MNTATLQALSTHIATWAAVPVSLVENSPISYSNSGGLGLQQRLENFAGLVRSHEQKILEPLGVKQGWVDQFLEKSHQYRLLLWQLPLPWIQDDKGRAVRVMEDIEGLGLSLRRLEKVIQKIEIDDASLSVGREVTHLRRWIASRSALAGELGSLLVEEPQAAVSIFYDLNIRGLRQFDPLSTSLDIYLMRHPSWKPRSNEAT